MSRRTRPVRTVAVTVLLADLGLLGAATPTAAARAPAGTWTRQSVPPPSTHVQHAELLDVSCPARSFCMAVGRYIPSEGSYRALAETWDGRRWTLHLDGLVKGLREIDHVSCTGRTRCEAAADTDDPATLTGDGERMLSWDGSTWTGVRLEGARRAEVPT